MSEYMWKWGPVFLDEVSYISYLGLKLKGWATWWYVTLYQAKATKCRECRSSYKHCESSLRTRSKLNRPK